MFNVKFTVQRPKYVSANIYIDICLFEGKIEDMSQHNFCKFTRERKRVYWVLMQFSTQLVYINSVHYYIHYSDHSVHFVHSVRIILLEQFYIIAYGVQVVTFSLNSGCYCFNYFYFHIFMFFLGFSLFCIWFYGIAHATDLQSCGLGGVVPVVLSCLDND